MLMVRDGPIAHTAGSGATDRPMPRRQRAGSASMTSNPETETHVPLLDLDRSGTGHRPLAHRTIGRPSRTRIS